jgi:hypothetical protein
MTPSLVDDPLRLTVTKSNSVEPLKAQANLYIKKQTAIANVILSDRCACLVCAYNCFFRSLHCCTQDWTNSTSS